jgi:hypothetical protein
VERTAAFKEAIMADIIKSRVYRDDELQKLYSRWLTANPTAYMPALIQAISEVQAQLDAPV